MDKIGKEKGLQTKLSMVGGRRLRHVRHVFSCAMEMQLAGGRSIPKKSFLCMILFLLHRSLVSYFLCRTKSSREEEGVYLVVYYILGLALGSTPSVSGSGRDGRTGTVPQVAQFSG